jgi:G3E family GTPase
MIDASSHARPRYIVVGGFPGAGKSTGIHRLAALFQKQGRTVGVITNDEGTRLVDTSQFRAARFVTEEIECGAFPTQLETFLTSARRLSDQHSCDIIFAECSGTSAELSSGLLTPLSQALGANVPLAPLSVLVDAVRASRVLRLDSGASFSEKLGYLYRKQIEEAENLVINKSDLLSAAQLSKLREALGELAPGATLLTVSARTGAGLDEWLACLMSKEHIPTSARALDSQLYHEAQSLIGWLNCTATVSSVKYFDANALINDLGTAIQSVLKGDGVEVAHLKLMLSAENESTGAIDIASVNLVRNDLAPELTGEIHEPVKRANLILNLRAEARPDLLHSAVNRAVLAVMERAPELFARMEHCEHFRPNRRT